MEEQRSDTATTEVVVDEIQELKEEMSEMQERINENNTMLRKIHRSMKWSFWLRVVWYGVLVGLPFALYFYVLEPYFTALGSNYETFSAGIQEIPGWKQLSEFFQESAKDVQ